MFYAKQTNTKQMLKANNKIIPAILQQYPRAQLSRYFLFLKYPHDYKKLKKN